MSVVEDGVARKCASLWPHLDERQRRLVLGAEAREVGRGGVKLVAAAAGVSPDTVAKGLRELQSGAAPTGRVRRPGGGRKALTATDPGLLAALEALVDPVTRGDPMSALRWTSKSTRTLAGELTAQGHRVSSSTVGQLLHAAGYSLQANVKVREGSAHQDRDAQFRYLNDQVANHQQGQAPVVSVDTKKKELVGDYKTNGQEWMPQGKPERVQVHDFPDPKVGKAIPYGVYDVGANTGWVSVGQDHDTSAFAVATLRRWWTSVGQIVYPAADRLLICADGGVQRLSGPGLEDRTRRAGNRNRPGYHRLPPAARDQQVEQDRAPTVQPHLHELARPPADQPRSRRRPDRRDHHPHRPTGARRTRPRRLPDEDQDRGRADVGHRPGPARLPRRVELHAPPRTTTRR